MEGASLSFNVSFDDDDGSMTGATRRAGSRPSMGGAGSGYRKWRGQRKCGGTGSWGGVVTAQGWKFFCPFLLSNTNLVSSHLQPFLPPPSHQRLTATTHGSHRPLFCSSASTLPLCHSERGSLSGEGSLADSTKASTLTDDEITSDAGGAAAAVPASPNGLGPLPSGPASWCVASPGHILDCRAISRCN